MRIGVIGYGSVGMAFHKLVMEKYWELKTRYGLVPQVVFICDSSGCACREEGLDPSEAVKVKSSGQKLSSAYRVIDVYEAIRRCSIDVAVECTPANFRDAEPAYSYIMEALRNGSNVITTNKGPMALYMPAILDEARSRGLVVLYSGTVGGGTPFISFVERALRGNRITSFRGILNGTSNYVLTRIMKDGMSLEEAVAEARRMGIAEADPSLDLNGTDSAAKLVILMNHIFENRYTLRDVKISGLDREIPEPERGHTVKLIARSHPEPRVSLEQIPLGDPLNVEGTYNAVEFSVEELGKVYLIGRGAGGRETAGAVIRDLVELKSRLQIYHYRKELL
ncbi:MAG: homoserine dehydrogenase [Nitrososphaeria archaeon]